MRKETPVENLQKMADMTAIFAGVAPVTRDLQESFMTRLEEVSSVKPRVNVIQFWGMTELGLVRSWDKKLIIGYFVLY
jgi:hypothetical protein